MSYGARERSRSSARPVNLLKFTWSEQEGGIAAYTDNDRIITFEGVAYQPVAVDAPSIRASGAPDRQRLELRLPGNVSLASLYTPFPPSEITTVRMFQGHRDDPNKDFKLVWAGRVLGMRRDPPAVVFVCEPVTSSGKRVGLRARWSYGCRHALYGTKCKANKDAATSEWTIDNYSIGTNDILMPEGFPASGTALDYLGGVIAWCGERGYVQRTILRVETDSAGRVLVALNGPTSQLEGEMTVRAIWGCDHFQSGCSLHNNLANFGGYPWIPQENPTAGRKNAFY